MDAKRRALRCIPIVVYLAMLGPTCTRAARTLQDGGCTAPYAQCGGTTCTNGSPSCTDAAYTCCPSNFACLRQSQWYWQCLPAEGASASAPATAPTGTTSTTVPTPQTPLTPPIPPLSSTPLTTFPPPPPEYSPSVEGYPPLPEEYAPESPPEGAAAPEGASPWLCDYAASGMYQFVSYLDKSGTNAPDGNYKETCQNIMYSCGTDTLTASCGIVDPQANITVAPTNFNTTSLTSAAYCLGNIANDRGVLVCQPYSDDVSSGSSATEAPCSATEFNSYYESKLDASGSDAPDGNYKQTCKQITYACNSDTIFASCWNGQTGANYRYLQTALQKSTLCYGVGSIDNVWGTLACVAFPSPEEEAPPEGYTPSEALPPSEEVLVLVGPAEGSSTEELSPESSPEYAYAPDSTQSGLCDYAASGEFQFISYLDGSGIDAPDGNYKERCKEIQYDCTTDQLTATCAVEDPLTPVAASATNFNLTSLSGAVFCEGNIAAVNGALVCQEYDAEKSPFSPVAPGPEAPCPALQFDNFYVSKLDGSGSDAPDGVYKETCRQISYYCALDTIYAKCGNGLSGPYHGYLETALTNASICEFGIQAYGGALSCAPYPEDYED